MLSLQQAYLRKKGWRVITQAGKVSSCRLLAWNVNTDCEQCEDRMLDWSIDPKRQCQFGRHHGVSNVKVEKSFVPALTLKTTNESQSQLVSFHSPPLAHHKMSVSESEDDFLKSLSSRGPNDNHPFGSPSCKSSPSGGTLSHPSECEEDSQLDFIPPIGWIPKCWSSTYQSRCYLWVFCISGASRIGTAHQTIEITKWVFRGRSR